ncbi:hypothetical protein GPJ56_007046 [Histomonas meleagridis]|uniref:uncharacterized protein n=1 Tax=Histomonas meleagridis TaxID=135588 RepID=UPI003559EB13|nr:hypothetical protein GPJ56_007046 [Histomonas meleagridis]KAH0801701.1 hypothetical protein GO595_005536 [Histomonas meleagridis]
MSFFNFLRSFPEFHFMLDAFNETITAEEKLLESIEKTFSDNFSEFAFSLPKELSTGLKNIRYAGIHQANAEKELVSTLKPLPNDLQILQVLQENIKKRTTVLENENGGQPVDPDVIKNDSEIQENKRQFVKELSFVLCEFVQARARNADQLVSVSHEFSEAALSFCEYEDPSIPKLENLLKELEYETV